MVITYAHVYLCTCILMHMCIRVHMHSADGGGLLPDVDHHLQQLYHSDMRAYMEVGWQYARDHMPGCDVADPVAIYGDFRRVPPSSPF
jgi:hypothetical protein